MRLLLIILALGQSLTQTKVDRIPQSEGTYSACDHRDVARKIQDGEKFPRGTIFHYGKKEILMKDVAEKNVPIADWNDFIIGDKTRFKLKRFRRGLYGTEFAEDADRFGDSTYNWLIEIKLKKSCLNSARTTSLVYLPTNENFKNWYGGVRYSKSFKEWKSFCFDSESYPRYEKFVNYKNPSEGADFSENECEKVAFDYYDQGKFAFIQDAAGDFARSWQIRDRDCIESISGSEDYWVKNLSKRSEFWKNTCNTQRNHRNVARVFFAAVATDGITTELAEEFAKTLQSSKEPEDVIDYITEEVDRFAAQDFAGAFSSAVRRCSGNGKMETFKKALNGISKNLDQMQSADVKTSLELLCR